MILIDLVYINSPGGVTLSKLLLDYIIDKVMSSNFEILVDKEMPRCQLLNYETRGTTKQYSQPQGK